MMQAVEWFRKAAELGLPQAQDALRSLAGTGDLAAQNALGLTYEHGWGTIQIDAEAVRWYRQAAQRGFAPAQFNLGRMYAEGRGIVKNEAEALQWFSLAAEQGDPDARARIKAPVKEQGNSQ
jgi:TPR repeat protein